MPFGRISCETESGVRVMIKAVIITEGELHDVIELGDANALQIYRDGFSAGANAYGAGSFGVYCLADLQDPKSDWHPDEDEAEVVREALGVK